MAAAPTAEADPAKRDRPVDVDVVICTYNSAAHIGACLAGLRDAGVTRSVTVVDNDSQDGTADVVRREAPWALVIPMGENAGYARAVNRGIHGGTGRHVLVLNPDTVVPGDALRTLVDFADAHPEAGVVAPRLRYADGRDQRTARSFPTVAAGVFGRRSPITRLWPANPWSRRYLRSDAGRATEPFRVDWVSGAAMLVPRRVVDRVGAFDEGFFLFWEDADWCRRITDHGFGVWCLPSATVTHDEGGSRDHGWSPVTIRAFHRGAFRFWAKQHPQRRWGPARWLVGGLLAARAAALLIRCGASGFVPDRRPSSLTVGQTPVP